MINKYEDKYRNYEIFMSLNTINDNKIIHDLKDINNMDNINNKINNILDLYENFNFYEITMIYNVKQNKNIKIFHKTFVNNNKNNCKIIYGHKEYELTETFNIKNLNKDKLKIKLRMINKISNIRTMFYECEDLESLPDISSLDTSNVTDMSFIFYKCSSLK